MPESQKGKRMVTIDKPTMDKLERYAGKMALARQHKTYNDEELFELEFELVEMFMPFVKTLVGAGLLYLYIDGNDPDIFKGVIGGKAIRAYENCGIILHAHFDDLGDEPLSPSEWGE